MHVSYLRKILMRPCVNQNDNRVTGLFDSRPEMRIQREALFEAVAGSASSLGSYDSSETAPVSTPGPPHPLAARHLRLQAILDELLLQCSQCMPVKRLRTAGLLLWCAGLIEPERLLGGLSL